MVSILNGFKNELEKIAVKGIKKTIPLKKTSLKPTRKRSYTLSTWIKKHPRKAATLIAGSSLGVGYIMGKPNKNKEVK